MKITINSSYNIDAIPEGVAAQKWSGMLSSSIPDEIEGRISIAHIVKLLELQIRDVDLVVWSSLLDRKLLNYYVDE